MRAELSACSIGTAVKMTGFVNDSSINPISVSFPRSRYTSTREESKDLASSPEVFGPYFNKMR